MTVVEQMLQRYASNTQEDRSLALREVMQEIALAGLNRGGFFAKAAFYGGTCLRIFHGLPRFFEDLDFSLLKPDTDFSFEPYFKTLRDEFAAFGFEVDTDPPLGFATEERLLIQPYSFYVKCFSLPDLFAGKMHALLYRKWKNRIKGRDWFDFEWYVRRGSRLNLAHFCERARQSGDLESATLTQEEFVVMLQTRIRSLDVGSARQDVVRFIKDADALNIWSQAYFLQLAAMIVLV